VGAALPSHPAASRIAKCPAGGGKVSCNSSLEPVSFHQPQQKMISIRILIHQSRICRVAAQFYTLHKVSSFRCLTDRQMLGLSQDGSTPEILPRIPSVP
jgi:hypothetical protein